MKIARKIPSLFWFKLFASGSGVEIGWFFFGLSITFVWGIKAHLSVYEMIAFQFAKEVTNGVLVEIKESNVTVDDTKIMKVHFRYEVAGNMYEGHSYLPYSPKPQTPLTIEYLAASPRHARIEGGSFSPAGYSGNWVLLFPGLSLLPLLIHLIRMLRRYSVMKRGLVAPAKLVRAEDTGWEVNDSALMRCRFVFSDSAGREHVHFRRLQLIILRQNADDWYIVYLPNKPSVAFLVVDLPGAQLDRQTHELSFRFAFSASDLLFVLAFTWAVASYFLFA